MTGSTLGVGVIGMSWVAGEHIKAYLANPHCDVVALAGSSGSRVAEVATAHGLHGAHQYRDWHDLIADARVHVVSICSTNEMHVPQAVAAAEAGKHVLIEKPVALDHEGYGRVQDAIERNGVKSQVGFELHWSPYFQSIHTMLNADLFGNIHYAECDYFSGNQEKWYGGYSWVKTKARGGSALAAAGCHAIDAIRQFVRAEAVEVFAYSGNFTHVMDWDATIVTVIRFANGAIGKVGCVMEGNVKYTFNVRLHGNKGTLVNDKFRSTVLDPGLDGWAHFPTILPDTPEVTHHPFPGEVDDFIDAILHDRRALVDITDAAKTHEIMFAAERSAREGRPIALPL
jgi:predicted dehydrogenase